MIHDAKCENLDDMMNDKCPNYDEKDFKRGKGKKEKKNCPSLQFTKNN